MKSWTIKKAEHQIDAFELWCWRRLLRAPWTARRSNQSILKETSPEYSLEGQILKYFDQLMERTDSLEKTLMLGKIEGGRSGWQRLRWLDGITDLMDISWSKLLGSFTFSVTHSKSVNLSGLPFLFCIMRGLENPLLSKKLLYLQKH